MPLIADLPPKLWLPPKPAIVRAASLRDVDVARRTAWREATFPFPTFVPVAAAGGVTPPSVSYRTNSSVGASPLSNPVSVSSIDIGTATATRYVVVAAFGIESDFVGGDVTGITIDSGGGDTAMTQVVEVSPGSGFVGAMFILQVTSGATGTIKVTFQSAAYFCQILVWALDNLTSGTAAATSSSTADPAALSLNVVAGDVIVGAACSNTTDSATWTGLTERFDATADGRGYTGADAVAGSTESPRTVNANWVDGSQLKAAVCAAWR